MVICTIGVYGSSARAFFEALKRAKVDTFCDVRARRGVRGRQYVFANSTRLQAALRKLGIRYLHFPELAPSESLRTLQAAADHSAHIARRQRAYLSPEFMAGYVKERLAGFNSQKFVEQLGPEAKIVALFCVEREPEACHRSLLADRLKRDLGVKVRHLTPGDGAV